MSIYIAGPVIRRGTTGVRWVNRAYGAIEFSVGRRNLPRAEVSLERASAQALFKAMHKRIAGSDRVISVLPKGYLPGVVEATIAALLGKPQLILSDDPARVSRLIKGLPGAVVGHSKEAPALIRQFLGSTGPRFGLY